MMPINSTDHIFISYSRKDEEFTRLIVASLRQQGINKIWVDSENLVPGTPIWEEEIEQAIRGSKALIVLCSPDAKRSEWVRREIAYAEQYGKSIIPVLIRGDKTESITISLITRQFLDLRSNTQKGLRQLSDLLAGLEKSNPAPKIDNVEFDGFSAFFQEIFGKLNANVDKVDPIEEQTKKIQELQELLRLLPNVPTLPIATFLEAYSDNRIDQDTKLKLILLEYRKRLVEDIEFMKARGEGVPENLERAIALMDHVLGYHWMSR